MSQRRRERWLFFLGLAVGLLAKGPLVLVLAGLPLGLWTLFNRLLTRGLMLSTVLFAGFVASLNLKQTEDWHTTQQLVAHYAALNTRHSALIFYPARPYSAAFYSRGKAEQITQPSGLLTRLTEPPAFLAVESSAVATLPAALHTQLQFVAQHGDYSLFFMRAGAAPVPKLTE